MAGWQLQVERLESLPPMAWLLRATPPVARLAIGSRVRASDAGVFEGTWIGEGGDLGPLRSTTPFGSGVLCEGEDLWLVPPGHTLECIYVCQRRDELLASNSLVGLLTLAGIELDPGVRYPPLFDLALRGKTHVVIPTTSDPIEVRNYDNLRLDLDGRLTAVAKPAEAPYTSFAEHRARLSAAIASAHANAPGYMPVVTISSGYDGAAVAALASELGHRRAVTIDAGKGRHGGSESDSGEDVGRRLGMDVTVVERLAYQHRSDLPEAEFLATGYTGEEITWSGMERVLPGAMLVSGLFGDGMWWMNRPPRPPLWHSDQSGSTLGEWRLRVGFIHVPLPCVGAQHHRTTRAISHTPEMRPWVLGINYDRPIPRRILEEAGVPRGTFATRKRAASGTLHSQGPAVLAPATREAVAEFARQEGGRMKFRPRPNRLWRRSLVKLARALHAWPIAQRLERDKFARSVMEPAYGSLLLRWAVSVVRPRYAEAAGTLREDGAG